MTHPMLNRTIVALLLSADGRLFSIQNQRHWLLVLSVLVVLLLVLVIWLALTLRRLDKAYDEIKQRSTASSRGLQMVLKGKQIDERMNKADEDDEDFKLFKRIAHCIRDEKLYLQPNITRDDIILKTSVPRNKFGKLFRVYAQTNFSQYINGLRMEYAAHLLVEQPNYTIEAVANECGMGSLPTFYRAFADRFGVTPTEYRQSALQNNVADDNDGGLGG